MAKPINVMVFIHGMIPDENPSDPIQQYKDFWDSLVKEKRDLPGLFKKQVYVQWGHEPPGLDNKTSDQLREDQRLTRAQQFIKNRVSYDVVRMSPEPNNVLLPLIRDLGIPFLRGWGLQLKEELILRGVGDVMYYASREGEATVRSVVYEKVLSELQPYEKNKDVRLHTFCHSLGVTITHDFLYGMFNTDKRYKSGYVKDNQASKKGKTLYETWRKKAIAGELKLGSLSSAASQLPLFVMRNQKLIDILARGSLLDPEVIGIQQNKEIQWQLFYDVDDPLGFTTRSLYFPNDCIREVQVQVGDLPDKAHTGYWKDKTVIRETAKLLASRAV